MSTQHKLQIKIICLSNITKLHRMHIMILIREGKETHSEDIPINYRHSQAFSKFLDDVYTRNLIHVSSTN